MLLKREGRQPLPIVSRDDEARDESSPEAAPITFHGQMPLWVWKNLDIAREHGGLFVAPTHLLEPEVPWENVEAYVAACREYKIGK